MNIWLQIKFRHYIIKTQESRIKNQESRIKNHESRIKNQESRIHSAQAGKPGLAPQPGQQATNQRWPIKQNTNRKWPKKQASSQSFPDYIQSVHQSVLPSDQSKKQRYFQEDKYGSNMEKLLIYLL